MRDLPLANPLLQIQTINGKVHQIVEFVTQSSRRAKALDTDYKDIGSFVDFELLGSCLMLLTLSTYHQLPGSHVVLEHLLADNTKGLPDQEFPPSKIRPSNPRS